MTYFVAYMFLLAIVNFLFTCAYLTMARTDGDGYRCNDGGMLCCSTRLVVRLPQLTQ